MWVKDFYIKMRDRLRGNEVFYKNEIQANRLGALLLFNTGLILAAVWILTEVGLVPLGTDMIRPTCLQGVIEILALVVICLIAKNRAWWLKYLLIIGLVLVYARLDSILTHKTAILMAVPVVFSSRYFSTKLTAFTTAISLIAFGLSAAWGAVNGFIDLNIVTMEKGTEMVATGGFLGDAVKNAGVTNEMLIKNVMLYNYIPKCLQYIIVAGISFNLTHRGREMVVTQHEKDIKTAQIESELNLATKIQANMLPNVFPPFPERKEFSVFASMNPAKEVGGDFYDFYFIDKDRLAIVMADVSGKGVPAALFMMVSKILVQNYALTGATPAEILGLVNERICANNKQEMFVTIWLGILDLQTGELTASNAGHEYPIVKKPGGDFEVLKDKHGFVVGGMSGILYKDYKITLEPGSKIFVYTDGLPEATNSSKELFGMDRTLEALRDCEDKTPAEILSGVNAAVDRFVGDATQFDDLTMLCLEYIKPSEDEVNKMTIDAIVENIDEVTDFVNERLDEHGCDLKTRTQIDVAIDELFGNIARYAYPEGEVGQASVEMNVDQSLREIAITFTDSGKPYNPLEADEPDIKLSAEERPIGGLGIFLVKKTMDDITYKYEDGHNILTIRKKY